MAEITMTRRGDYYYASGDQAWTVADALGLVVTRRRDSEQAECAIPAHRLDGDVATLRDRGMTVSVGEARP